MPSFEIFHSSKYPALELEPGWYYRECQPGAEPTGEPVGAFETRQQAEAAVDLELAELGDSSVDWLMDSITDLP